MRLPFKLVAGGLALLIGSCANASPEPASSTAEPLLVRISTQSKGMMPFDTVYELSSNGQLSIQHGVTGGHVIEERQVRLESSDLAHCQELLARDGLRGAMPEAARTAIASRAKSSDGFMWLVEVFGPARSSVTIPPQYESRFSPELAEVPYLRTAWELISSLESKWAGATKVERP